MAAELGNVLVTGADGFVGKNACMRFREIPGTSVLRFVRADDLSALPLLLAEADAVVHLAGENRPADDCAFDTVNVRLTSALCEAVSAEHRRSGRRLPLIFASSIQVERDNPYGRSKLAAEGAVSSLASTLGNCCTIFRLPGVFGKWCRPNYNSVVATFAHNLARGLPIQINDPFANLRLVYVDDVVSAFISALESSRPGCTFATVRPEYSITLGELASVLQSFSDCRSTLVIGKVGTGLKRALYSTYVSYLPKDKFSYEVAQHADPRGVFVEMLKTEDSGQFSFFTAGPGVTRGGHYHHTKTEKFLVVKGEAVFRFRHMGTNELVELHTSGARPRVVDTIPGWAHDITNVGNDELVVMLWANENFDRQKPDTVTSKV